MSICEKHIWPVFKIILSIGTPLQKIIDRGGDTHLFLNDQALTLLENDRRLNAYQLISKYKTFIDMGNLWADKGWKCFAHYYKPQDQKGFMPWISATTEGLCYLERALSKWKEGRYDQSMFYLGAVAHIVQDVCVPHHAMGIAFNGHRRFETWAIQNKHFFRLDEGGFYNEFCSLEELIDNNATTAQSHYCDVAYYNSKYVYAGKKMLYLAQRSTAHLFDQFTKTVTCS